MGTFYNPVKERHLCDKPVYKIRLNTKALLLLKKRQNHLIEQAISTIIDTANDVLGENSKTKNPRSLMIFSNYATRHAFITTSLTESAKTPTNLGFFQITVGGIPTTTKICDKTGLCSEAKGWNRLYHCGENEY